MKARILKQYIRGNAKATRKVKRLTNSKVNRSWAKLSRNINRIGK